MQRCWFNRIFILAFALISFWGYGQDSTAILKADSIMQVEIAAIKKENTTVSQFTIHHETSLAEALLDNSAVFIKQYGAGQLATISVNGLNAAQTNLVWNGLKLNSPMLGQVDYSIIPTFANQEVQFTDAIDNLGGAITINNKSVFSERWSGSIGVGVASFQNYVGSGKINFFKNGFFSSTSFRFHRGKNNYKYFNLAVPSNEKVALINAEVENFSINQSFGKTFNKSEVALDFLHVSSNRNLPPTVFESSSTETQNDQIYGAVLNYHQTLSSQVVLEGTIGYQYQRIDFKLSEQSLPEVSKTGSLQTNVLLHQATKNNNLRFEYGVKLTHETGNINAYTQVQKRTYNQLHAKSKYQWKDVQFDAGIASFFGANTPVFLPNLGVVWKQYELPSNLVLSAKYARHFRLPNLNDIFWEPGGNPDLLPELSHQFNLQTSISDNFKGSSWEYKIGADIFQIFIDNYIQWSPTNQGYWSPENIGSVYSRGAKWHLDLEKNWGKWNLKNGVQYQFTRTSNREHLNQQLIYVPINSFRMNTQVNVKKLTFGWMQQFVDRVYTNAANSSSLNKYYLLDGFVRYRIVTKSSRKSPDIQIEARANNILNKEYQVVINRPMMGVNFGVSCKLLWNNE